MFAPISGFARRNALGLIAIFIAMSGTAYAATSVAPNSVGTIQLRNSAVTGAKLAKAAVTASKVKTGSLTGRQINSATLGLVPNARRATSADHATDADELAGNTPADFAPAREVRTSGWITTSSCGTNCATNVDLVNNNTYDLAGGCQGNTSGNGAYSFLIAKPIGLTGTYFEAFSHTQEAAPNDDIFFVSVSGTTTAQVDGVNFDLVSPDGKSLAGIVTAIANYPNPGQCAFKVSALSG